MNKEKSCVVLHITESFGGGVIASISNCIDYALHATHYLLVNIRTGDDIGIDFSGRVKKILYLPSSHYARIAYIKKTVKKINPDIIHAHSSFAGGYTRLACFFDHRVIYTPRGFSFLRRDISVFKRLLFFIMESFLSLPGGNFAPCGPYEEKLCKYMLGARNISALYNISDAVIARSTTKKREHTICTIGRICPQKDPLFFAEVVKKVRAKDNGTYEIKFLWIGGENARYNNQCTVALEQAGVTVTGMMSHDEAMEMLCECTLYIQTSSWEGHSVTLLEAATHGVPILGRNIGAFKAIPGFSTCTTPDDFADNIISFFNGNREKAQANSEAVQNINNKENLMKALQKIYQKKEVTES